MCVCVVYMYTSVVDVDVGGHTALTRMHWAACSVFIYSFAAALADAELPCCTHYPAVPCHNS